MVLVGVCGNLPAVDHPICPVQVVCRNTLVAVKFQQLLAARVEEIPRSAVVGHFDLLRILSSLSLLLQNPNCFLDSNLLFLGT